MDQYTNQVIGLLVKDEDLGAADVVAHLAVVTVEAAIVNKENLDGWNVIVTFICECVLHPPLADFGR